MLTRRELTVLGLAFLISLPLVTTRFYSSDEIEHFAWLRSITFDRDVSFENEYQYFYDANIARAEGFHETFLERRNETGKRINYAPVGAAVMWAPFYAAGHIVALASGAPADGFSRPYIASVAYASAAYGFGTVLLCTLIVRRLFGQGLAPAIAVAIGTPLLFYAYIAPGFGHAASAFCVSLFVLIWLRARERWSASDAVLLGLSGGLMALVREQDGLLVIGPGLDFLLSSRVFSRGLKTPGSEPPGSVRAAGTPRSVRSFFATAAAGTGAFAMGIAPQLLAYKALNGHFGQTETAANKMSWSSPHGLSVLFNLEHGLLAWTPLVALAIAGLVYLAVKRRGTPVSRVAALALLMIAAQAYTSGIVDSWSVSGAFGQRRFIALTPLLAIGLAGFFTAASAMSVVARRVAVVAVAICIWWNLGLMAQFGLHRMDRKRLTLAENARVTFLQLPIEAPQIAWRYLTDRQSLYKQPRQ